jgi:hypothetical protein
MSTLSLCAAGTWCTYSGGPEGLDNSTHFCFDCRLKIHCALFCGKVLDEYTNESCKLNVNKLSPKGRDTLQRTSPSVLYICHTCINRHELLGSTASIEDKDNNQRATKKRNELDVIEIDGNEFPSTTVRANGEGDITKLDATSLFFTSLKDQQTLFAYEVTAILRKKSLLVL